MMTHPRPGDYGQIVRIESPHTTTTLESWQDPTMIAVATPNCVLPAQINGIKVGLQSDDDLRPLNLRQPDRVRFNAPIGLAAAAGAVIIEPDHRIWLVAPTNGFGGYSATFPKGRLEGPEGLQETAIREAWEESGLRIQLIAFLADVPRTQTYTRYFIARRIGGDPSRMGWESQAVILAPVTKLADIATHSTDQSVIAALTDWLGRVGATQE